MSVDRVATASQTAYFLTQIENAGSALDKTQQQIASGVNATTYAGFGSQAQVLTATLAANARNSAYTTATNLASTQVSLQDTQLTTLSSLATQLKTAISNAVANNDASDLMTQAQSIFSQASSILNSKDANGNYIFSGGNTNTAPVSATSLSGLASLPSVASAFTNGSFKTSVQVADGQTVTYGITASDIATGLMQELQSLAQFDAGANGNLNSATSLSSAQNSYLSGAISTADTVANNLNSATAANGYVANQLTDAQSQQASMTTLYKGFASNIQDTNMAQAATQLSLNQTQLQAALQVTAGLHSLSLLNYLPASSTG
ncbi:MAG TPA: flagellin [Rhizomicrobium sp.]|nr:flagellin [Rhizomicrobium sp.]